MLTIGLTGDVGAGKSTLCRVWREMGAAVFDADSVARGMWDLPEIRGKAEERWGVDFFHGDKQDIFARIAAKIFGNAEEYKFVSGLLHEPTVMKLKESAAESNGWVVVEIPLLYECGVPEWIDEVVYAAASTEKRIERNKSRGWDEREILRRDSRLLPREEKICRADFVLENNGTLEEWEEKARRLGMVFIEKLSR